ncbi:MAG: MarR family transcriptional regulator [Lachnospiraceae bacterium]|nr:MarR family transcriptional regulator [Lachnospiraceae bacterium]
MVYDISSAEQLIFQVLDQCHFMFFPNQWIDFTMDYSKNELLALLLVYRKGETNMTDVADYIMSPLNTATGVIGRLEKRGMVSRQRSEQDKRVMTVALSAEGRKAVKQFFEEVNQCFKKVLGVLSADEIASVLQVLQKAIMVLNTDSEDGAVSEEKKKSVRKINIT